jgi:hypothetical protein
VALASYLIPLYRSARFADIIAANIAAIIDDDVEIILSDRNGDETCAAVLKQHFGRAPNIAYIVESDDADWVDNMNGLLKRASGRYVRILPHDDSSPRRSHDAMLAALEANPDAIAAFGPVEAIGLAGNRLPERDQSNSRENPQAKDWELGDPLPLFWTGRFAGAFKGMFRGDVIRARSLHIRKTPALMHSERAWLFGMGLAGRFQFVPDAPLVKRYHETSTHRGWRPDVRQILDAAEAMAGYLDADWVDPAFADAARRDLYWNAFRHARRFPDAPRPLYLPYPASDTDRVRSLPIRLESAEITRFGSD